MLAEVEDLLLFGQGLWKGLEKLWGFVVIYISYRFLVFIVACRFQDGSKGGSIIKNNPIIAIR